MDGFSGQSLAYSDDFRDNATFAGSFTPATALGSGGSAAPLPRAEWTSDELRVMRQRKLRHWIYASLVSLSLWVIIISAVWFGFIR